jgi:hypothetical protein
MTATKADLESWHKDKACKDNIVESWLCIDCGVNTHPGSPSGPEVRIDLALRGACTYAFDHCCEVYTVKRELWEKVGMKPWGGCLCVGCLEERLGRQLRPKDFAHDDGKVWARLPCTDRLLDRRGFRQIRVRTRDGEKEVILAKSDADKLAKLTPPGQLPFLDDDADEE